MKTAKLAQTTQSTSTTTDSIVDVYTTSGICCINVAGGTGTGTVTVRGVLQTPDSNFSLTSEDEVGDATDNLLTGADFSNASHYTGIFGTSITASSTTLPWTDEGTCYRASGTANNSFVITGKIPANAEVPLKDASSVIMSVYVKQFDVEADAIDVVKFGIYDRTATTTINTFKSTFGTYGGAPTTSDATGISFSGVEDVGSGWYRLWAGMDGLVLATHLENDNITFYIEFSDSGGAHQFKEMFIASPMLEQFEKGTKTTPGTYSISNPRSAVDFPVLWTETISPDTNYKETIPMYPKFRVEVDNSTFAATQIDVDLGHN